MFRRTGYAVALYTMMACSANGQTVRDFNGDGIPDFLTVRENASVLSLQLSKKEADKITYGPATVLYRARAPMLFSYKTGDANEDGKLDIEVYPFRPLRTPGLQHTMIRKPLLLLNKGNGTFAQAAPIRPRKIL